MAKNISCDEPRSLNLPSPRLAECDLVFTSPLTDAKMTSLALEQGFID